MAGILSLIMPLMQMHQSNGKVSSIDETQGVCSFSFAIIPSSSISVSFSRAGSKSAIGIFLGGCTTGGTDGSTYKCTLFGSLSGLSLKQSL